MRNGGWHAVQRLVFSSARSLAGRVGESAASAVSRGLPAVAGSPSPVIVCVHGFGGFRWQMAPMAAALKSAGFVVYNYAYAARKHTLEEHGVHFAEFLTSVASTPLNTSGSASSASPCTSTAAALTTERVPSSISFVTHSFGGVLLREALMGAAWQALRATPVAARRGRAVCLGPPFGGVCMARGLRYRGDSDSDGRLPYRILERLVRMALGPGAGRQLLEMSREWFMARGGMPPHMPVLVIAGDIGRVNPLITEPMAATADAQVASMRLQRRVLPSDGVVGVHETYLPSRHMRLTLRVPHNMLLYAPAAIQATTRFLLAQGDDDVAGLAWAAATTEPGVVGMVDEREAETLSPRLTGAR
eukprot:ctg_2689.g684